MNRQMRNYDLYKGGRKFKLKRTFGRIRFYLQKQQPRGILNKRCSENMQQIYRRTPMPKYDFNNVATLLKSHFGMGTLL